MRIVFGEREIEVSLPLFDRGTIRASLSARQDFIVCGMTKMQRPCPDHNGLILCEPRQCKLLTGGVDTSDLLKDADTNALSWMQQTE